MKRLQKAALFCEMLDRMIKKGSWGGETHLQKCVFFLQEMRNVPTGYTFQLYKYGPYSFDLHDEIVRLRGIGMLSLFSRKPQYGAGLKISELGKSLRRHFPRTLEKYSDDIDFVTDHFGDLSASELGKLATAYYFILQDQGNSDEEIAVKINGVKSHIANSEGIEATKRVREISKLKETANSTRAMIS